MDLEEVRSKVLPVLKRYGVRRASVFGSLVREETAEESDVDLLVELGDDKSLLDLAGLKIEAEELLGRRVDVLTYNAIHPLLRERILSEQKAIL